MELKNLQKHIRTLAILPETNAPVVSCYMTLKKGRIDDRIAFEEQIHDTSDSEYVDLDGQRFTPCVKEKAEEPRSPSARYSCCSARVIFLSEVGDMPQALSQVPFLVAW